MPAPPPQLLVSVRDVAEARSALAGGADLIDVKEPAAGPLGRSGRETIEAVAALVRRQAPDTPVSAALGELPECLVRPEPLDYSVDYLKIGLAGAGPAWRDELDLLRDRSIRSGDAFGPRWIAVAYADWQRAAAPEPAVILEYALEADCPGLLVDTYGKGGEGLLRHLPAAALEDLIRTAHDEGLFVALAGQVRESDLAELVGCDPDILAVRTSVCAAGERRGPVAEPSVREFRRRLHDASAACPFLCASVESESR